MFVTNWISTTKIQKISEITNFFRHYFLSRTEVLSKNNAMRSPLDFAKQIEDTEMINILANKNLISKYQSKK